MSFYVDWASRWIYRNAQQVYPFSSGVDDVSSCLNVMCGSWQQMSTCSSTLALWETEESMNFARQQDVMLQCWTLFCLSLDCQKHEGISENERSWAVFAKSEFHRRKRKCIFLTHGWFGRIRTISDCHCFWIQEEWSSLCALTKIPMSMQWCLNTQKWT